MGGGAGRGGGGQERTFRPLQSRLAVVAPRSFPPALAQSLSWRVSHTPFRSPWAAVATAAGPLTQGDDGACNSAFAWLI